MIAATIVAIADMSVSQKALPSLPPRLWCLCADRSLRISHPSSARACPDLIDLDQLLEWPLSTLPWRV
jgi:hypothetical protein